MLQRNQKLYLLYYNINIQGVWKVMINLSHKNRMDRIFDQLFRIAFSYFYQHEKT